MNGPSEHLSWAEMACRNGVEYPQEWRSTRAVELARAFERVRELCGFALIVDSAYRTPAYNRYVGGAKDSQHVQGRALDLVPSPPGKKALIALRGAVERAKSEGLIRGVGFYSGFIHIDTRPGSNKTWHGGRKPINMPETIVKPF